MSANLAVVKRRVQPGPGTLLVQPYDPASRVVAIRLRCLREVTGAFTITDVPTCWRAVTECSSATESADGRWTPRMEKKGCARWSRPQARVTGCRFLDVGHAAFTSPGISRVHSCAFPVGDVPKFRAISVAIRQAARCQQLGSLVSGPKRGLPCPDQLDRRPQNMCPLRPLAEPSRWQPERG